MEIGETYYSKDQKYKLVIQYEEDPMNPRTEWDNACTMVCQHKNYILGDIQYKNDEAGTWDEWIAYYFQDQYGILGKYIDCDKDIENIHRWIAKHVYIKPIYMYDHSGITINTTGFSCGWDSGKVGYIFITKTQAKEESGGLEGKELDEWAERILLSEVQTYDDYITGTVYRFSLYEKSVWINKDDEDWQRVDWEWVDGCGGYYGKDGKKMILEDHDKYEFEEV